MVTSLIDVELEVLLRDFNEELVEEPLSTANKTQ